MSFHLWRPPCYQPRYLFSRFVVEGDTAISDETFQVIEGQLENINIEVNGCLNSGYVRQRLRQAATPVLNANSDDGPDSRFFAWRGQAQWVRASVKRRHAAAAR